MVLGAAAVAAAVALTVTVSARDPDRGLDRTASPATAPLPTAPSAPERSGGTIELALPLPPAGNDSGDADAAAATPSLLPRSEPRLIPSADVDVPRGAAPATAPEVADTAPAAVDPAPAAFGDALDDIDGTAGTLALAPARPLQWKSLSVRSGDSLAAIFRRAGLTPRDVHEVVNAGEPSRALTRIFPGDEIHLGLDAGQALAALRYEINETDTLHVRRAGQGYTAEVSKRELERRHRHTTAVIRTSLYEAAVEAGLDDRLIMELAGIFGWDVDFALDIRDGDSFVVIYDEVYRDGERLRSGDILAAEFVNRGERFQAVRYTDPEGRSDYFAPDGRSMRKAFLRTPINFARVSSNFNPQRFHPVLGVKRPHMGTDYAARPGTPIKAAGDGRIIHRGRKGGYGRTVIIQHGASYTTLYAHMSGYRSGQRVGSRVRQGEVIGYVGSSGLATGPHLHYEFRINGVHRNPRTVKLPDAEPIDPRYREDFLAHAEERVAELELISRTQLALGGDH